MCLSSTSTCPTSKTMMMTRQSGLESRYVFLLHFFTFITLSTGVYGMGSTMMMMNSHLVHLHRTGPLATNLEVRQQQGLNKDSSSRRSCILILDSEYVSFFAFVTLLAVFFIRLIFYQQHMMSHNEVPNDTLPSFGPPPITPLLFRVFFPLFSTFLGLFFRTTTTTRTTTANTHSKRGLETHLHLKPQEFLFFFFFLTLLMLALFFLFFLYIYY